MGIFSMIKEKLNDINEKAEQEKKEKEKQEVLKNENIAIFSSGTLPIVDTGTVLILKKGEVAHNCEIVKYCKTKSQANYQAGYGGASFRVAKGVTIRSGGVKGKRTTEEIEEWFNGGLIVTNKRVAFIPKQDGAKPFNVPLDQIMSLQHYKNGVIIQTEKASHKFSCSEYETLCAIINGALTNLNT